jgi:hypothetical protein
MAGQAQFDPNAAYSPVPAAAPPATPPAQATQQPAAAPAQFNPNAAYGPAQATDLTANPQGQGVYQMVDPNGKQVNVPYGSVTTATKQGYKLSGSAFDQYRKDVSADPNADSATKSAVTDSNIQSGIGEGLGDVWNAVKSGAKGLPEMAIPGGDAIDKSIHMLSAYEKSRSSGASVADSLKAAAEAENQSQAIRQTFKERADAFNKNPTQETARGVLDAAGLIASIFATRGVGAEGELGAAAEGAEATTEGGEAANAAAAGSPAKPRLVQKIFKGSDVAQPAAQSAVRQGVAASADASGTGVPMDATQPILKGGSTILDDHLTALKTQAKAAYKQVDDLAGFDLKAEKAQLANDQYKLSQLGNTDADITQRRNLNEAINDSQDRITAAEQKLKAAGVDPDAADAKFKQVMAGQDFKKALVRSTSPDGGSVDVDKLLTQSKNLRFAKNGDRLAQFFGSKDAADAYMDQLQRAQQLGIHAMKVQRLARWAGGIAGTAVLGSGVVKGIETLLQ